MTRNGNSSVTSIRISPPKASGGQYCFVHYCGGHEKQVPTLSDLKQTIFEYASRRRRASVWPQPDKHLAFSSAHEQGPS